jgi:tetratricopeptide (TPR) repeat protein
MPTSPEAEITDKYTEEEGFIELADESTNTHRIKDSTVEDIADTGEEDGTPLKRPQKSFDLLDFDVMEPSFYQLDDDVKSIEGLSELSKSINLNAKKKNQTQEEKPEKGRSKDNLIDKFLETGPKLAPVKKDDVQHEDISEQSAEETDEFMTETLAHVYVKQGYYEKAIKAFQKLSLKYPEKSVYFGRQIEEVRKLLNR